MIVMSVACEHGAEIVQRALATIARVNRGGVGGMASDHVAGLAWSLMAMVLPRSDSRLVMLAALDPSSRMQPPCTPAVIRTSNPCSNGLSQRRAIPMPASALPVAIASRSCSVEPPKLMKSTSRLCFAKTPRSFATGAAAVQIDVAFHASVSARGGPDNPSPVMAARQRGNPSARGALFTAVSARAAPTIATGVAIPKIPARPRTVRRESRIDSLAFLLFSPFSMMILPGRAFIKTWRHKAVYSRDLRAHLSAEARRHGA